MTLTNSICHEDKSANLSAGMCIVSSGDAQYREYQAREEMKHVIDLLNCIYLFNSCYFNRFVATDVQVRLSKTYGCSRLISKFQ